NSRLPTTLNARDQPPAEVSDQRVSGLTGAVQGLLVSGNGLSGFFKNLFG
ncbi:PPE family protein PPE39, partial [Mycobacterium tuberculosis Wt 21231]